KAFRNDVHCCSCVYLKSQFLSFHHDLCKYLFLFLSFNSKNVVNRSVSVINGVLVACSCSFVHLIRRDLHCHAHLRKVVPFLTIIACLSKCRTFVSASFMTTATELASNVSA